MERRRQANVARQTRFEDPALVDALLADVRFAWVWLGLRVYLGWTWLGAGWRRLDDPVWADRASNLARLVAIGETLAGIALILGILTGAAAFVGALIGVDVGFAGAVMDPAVFALAVALVLGWKAAGWIGLDRWLLPALGLPWHGGRLFGGASRVTDRRGRRF